MGGTSSVGPHAANIVLYKFFQKINRIHLNLIWDHARFIDDLFGTWNKPKSELYLYFNTLNAFNPSFKFTLNHSNKDIPFLDVKIINTIDALHTTIYNKPTDKKLFLNFFSNYTVQTKNQSPLVNSLDLNVLFPNQRTYRIKS